MNTPLKACKDCGQLFPATTEYFYPERRTKCGIAPRCYSCYRAHHAKAFREWREKNPERNHETHRHWVNDNRERARELDRNRYKRDADKRKQWQRDYRIRSPHKITRGAKKAIHKANYMTAKKRLPSTFTKHHWDEAMKHFEYRCAVCRRPRGLWHKIVPDHWIPMKSDKCPGTTPENIVPLCHGIGGCNNRKQNKDALDWLCETYGDRKGKEIFNRIQQYLTQLKPGSRRDDQV